MGCFPSLARFLRNTTLVLLRARVTAGRKATELRPAIGAHRASRAASARNFLERTRKGGLDVFSERY